MKIERLLYSIPFPYRIQGASPYSLEYESKGNLFNQPNYRKLNCSFWESIESEGWLTCRAGFAVFVRRLPGNTKRLLVLHGLKVKPFWTQRGGKSGLSIVLNINQIESYVDRFLKEFEKIIIEIDQEIYSRTQKICTEGIHEIRSMNTSLYHVGFELHDCLEKDDFYERFELPRAKNIVALSELISARIELFDHTASGIDMSLSRSSPTTVAVYKKFDKVIKCYIAYAFKRGISLELKGESRNLVNGNELFEMIPLIIIDNAVKYSPNDENVNLSIREDHMHIYVEVTSYGPKIEEYERDLIFNREYRGANALKNGTPGSGIGLYFVRRLLESIGATITVKQETTSIKVLGKTFHPTTFCIKFNQV